MVFCRFDWMMCMIKQKANKKQIDFRYEFEDSESYAKKLRSTII
jgi:hypothetical protein